MFIRAILSSTGKKHTNIDLPCTTLFIEHGAAPQTHTLSFEWVACSVVSRRSHHSSMADQCYAGVTDVSYNQLSSLAIDAHSCQGRTSFFLAEMRVK